MTILLNTLYVTTNELLLRLDHETIKGELAGETKMQIPLHHIGAIYCFGSAALTSPLMTKCAEDGRYIAFFTENGRFRFRVEGPTSGNVLLRKAQYDALNNKDLVRDIAAYVVAGKIQNCRQIIMRGAREAEGQDASLALRGTAAELSRSIGRLSKYESLSIDQIRGIEGDAARTYFSAFPHLVRVNGESFQWGGRNRRPPRDRVNSLLSFLYALILNECVSALEGVGLDPQAGYLHALRPGKPALALDLMEEFRALLGDRIALTLINRQQVTPEDFVIRPGGAVEIKDAARKEILIAYQKRKSEELQHPILDRKVALGLLPHIQARLLARFLRGDTEKYTPFLYR